ncbi:MAG: serine--tRNA ligase [Bacteroidales bacterium]|nr:serine--tRNA ligase [Bacteroidales bacterium]
MLQISYIRENPQDVIRRLAVKNLDVKGIVNQIVEMDQQRRTLQKQHDELQAEINRISKEIGILFKSGQKAEATTLKERSSELKADSRSLADTLAASEEELNKLILQLPNLPHHSVPAGKNAAQNEIVAGEGDLPVLEEGALPHWELAQKYDLISFELGSKVTGAGFPFYKGKGARLERALISFFLDEAARAGYEEFLPPLLVNEDSAFGTGQLPDKDGQMYAVNTDNLFLIPTAEVPVTNLYRDVILTHDRLPVRNVAYSSCFRREAGSWGKDVRGLNRLHQFNKVEIVQIAHPDKSYESLSEMRDHVASLVRKLELPFRIVRLCGGDLSFTSALTYDFEVYSAAQDKWLEVSSVSNFETFQSCRLKLRFRDTDGKVRLAHTLNGSALALPRIMAALLENNQSHQGIRIPGVLVPYTGFNSIP